MQLLSTAHRLGQTANAAVQLLAQGYWGKEGMSPTRLRDTFERLGATYTKIGQFIASAPSVFSPDYVAAFQGCLDRSPPIPFELIEQTLARELHRAPEECFESIEPNPLASASIAQVHAARLKRGGDVVLKVQKPGVAAKLQTDLSVLRALTGLAEYFQPILSRARVPDVIADMRRTFRDECDFLVEADRIKKYDAFLRRARIWDVVVPRVYGDLTTSKVLVMERFYGAPLTDVISSNGVVQSPLTPLANAMNAWATSVSHCEFFHADVHAGNLLLLKDGRAAFIDFGIVGTIEPKAWQAALSLVAALAQYDSRSVAKALVELGATDEDVQLDALASDVAQLLQRIGMVAPQRMSNSRDVTSDVLLLDLFAIGDRHGLRLPRELFLLLKQYLYFDRYLRVLSPGMVEIFSIGRKILGS